MSPAGVHQQHSGLHLAIYAAVGLLIALAFFLSPLPDPDDWTNLYNGVNRFLHRQALYTQAFVNPPHVAVLLIPLAILPMRAGYAILSAITLCGLAAIAFRRQLGAVKTAALLLSPPVLYSLLHGQIDVLMLAVLLLPRSLWVVAALGKPQVAGGLILRSGLTGWAITSAIALASFALYPAWLSDLMREAAGNVGLGWNVLGGYWPQQLALAAGMLYVGYRRNDENFLVGASPFLLPYAALSSYIGLWLLACSKLDRIGLCLVWITWWAAIIWRVFN